jgi:DNA-binding SARP family transcriptional activator
LIRGYVSKLRGCLGDRKGAVLRTVGTGYLLQVPPGGLDAQDFARLLRESRQPGLNPGERAELLAQVEALWRGSPYAGVPPIGSVQADITRLEEDRLVALEEQIGLRLAAGEHAAVIGTLSKLVSVHPLREQFRHHLMVALYRCGRHAEALDVYRELRQRMQEELGMEPSRGLRELQFAVLQQDFSLEPSSIPQSAPVVPPSLDPEPTPPSPPTSFAVQPFHEAFEQSAQPSQDRAGDDTHDSALDCRVIPGGEGRRSGHRVGVTVGLAMTIIGFLAAVVFMLPNLHEEANDKVSGFVAYDFEQGISTDAQDNRYVTDSTGHGHVGYLKTNHDGDLTVIDHPGHGKAVHFPAPCASTPTTTCPLAFIQTQSADDFNPGTRDFSFGADVSMKSAETRRHASIIQKGPVPNPGGEWKLQIEDMAGAPSCIIAGKESPSVIYRAVSTVSVADGSWHNIQCIKTATALTVYVDSANRGRVSLPAGLTIENGYPLSVGGLYIKQVSNNDQFFGALDNVYFSRP